MKAGYPAGRKRLCRAGGVALIPSPSRASGSPGRPRSGDAPVRTSGRHSIVRCHLTDGHAVGLPDGVAPARLAPRNSSGSGVRVGVSVPLSGIGRSGCVVTTISSRSVFLSVSLSPAACVTVTAPSALRHENSHWTSGASGVLSHPLRTRRRGRAGCHSFETAGQKGEQRRDETLVVHGWVAGSGAIPKIPKRAQENNWNTDRPIDVPGGEPALPPLIN